MKKKREKRKKKRKEASGSTVQRTVQQHGTWRKRSITAESLRKNRGTRLSLLRPLPLIAFCPRRNTHSFDRNWDPSPVWERDASSFKTVGQRALCFVLARSCQCDFPHKDVNFSTYCGWIIPRILKSTDRILRVCKTHGVDYWKELCCTWTVWTLCNIAKCPIRYFNSSEMFDVQFTSSRFTPKFFFLPRNL